MNLFFFSSNKWNATVLGGDAIVIEIAGVYRAIVLGEDATVRRAIVLGEDATVDEIAVACSAIVLGEDTAVIGTAVVATTVLRTAGMGTAVIGAVIGEIDDGLIIFERIKSLWNYCMN